MVGLWFVGCWGGGGAGGGEENLEVSGRWGFCRVYFSKSSQLRIHMHVVPTDTAPAML